MLSYAGRSRPSKAFSSTRTRAASAAETPLNLAVLLALSIGMREGELCGFTWGDVSLPIRTLWVRKSIARDGGSYYVKCPTFHDLRHASATYAIAEGVDVKTVSSILGHSNAAMTLNIYASADAGAKLAAASTIEDVMGRRLTAEEIRSLV